MSARFNTSLLLCFLAAVVEGIDIIAFGLAAPEVRNVLGLSTDQIAVTASANMAAFIVGALAAGRASDRVPRQYVLVAAMICMGVFSLATATAGSFEILLLYRTLTGVGLGAAMPMFIALAAESGPPAGRMARVSVMLSGSPLGGIIASLFVATAWGADWRAIFVLGGLAPILLAPFLIKGIRVHPETETAAPDAAVPPRSPLRGMFQDGLAVLTGLLWLGLLANQVLTYTMFAWLPILLRDLGLERWQASVAMGVFMASAVVGNIGIARFVGGAGRWVAVGAVSLGTVVSLLAFGAPGHSFWTLVFVSGLAGMFILSATVLLYGLAADLYPISIRGSGVGAATAVGRGGAIGGPLLAGALLGLGATTATLMPALSPFALIGGVAAVLLARQVEKRP
jgi:AAHS family 3-hydroxyphenylpropionic acid transporter